MRQRGWLRLYELCLWTFPVGFRRKYGKCMVQAFEDALKDPAVHRRRLLWRVWVDLAVSIAKENMAMLVERLAERSIVFHAVLLGVVGTMLALTICITMQQALRMGADDPQKQLAGDAAAELEQGADAAAIVGDRRIDPQRSLSPFIIVLNDAGQPVASSVTLNGATPVPPSGVLEYVRQHQVDVLTWQPRRGVRIAAVIRRIAGDHAGFVLAGRSLEEVENRKETIGSMMQIAWLGMVIVLVLATFVFSRHARGAQAA